MCAANSDNTNRNEERKKRLHSQPEFWRFDGKGQLIDGRYLSVVLQVSGRGADGVIEQFEQRRVWDAENGILCPLDCFLPRKNAKKYQKWAYSLENGFILVYKNNRKNKKKPAQPVKLVKK